MGISIGLGTAMRALLTHQQGMDMTSHNISNVNTVGYSRQRLRLAAVGPAAPIPGFVGGGVETLGVERIRDLFVDFQMRSEQQEAGRYGVRSSALELAEITLGEPGDNGLRRVLDEFWNAWRDVSNAPEQSAARSALVQAGVTLSTASTRIDSALRAMRGDMNQRVAAGVDEVNALARDIGDLNQQIILLRAAGDPASDLTDRRDLALDRLSRLANVEYTESESGSLTVSIGGRSLVAGTNVAQLQATPNVANENYFDIEWAADGAPAKIDSGELFGMIESRDTDLKAMLDGLNTLVAQVITDVNAAHAAGFALDGVTTGVAFFSGVDASNIAVDAAVAGNVNLIAAAAGPGAVGDGGNALALADLQFAMSLGAGTETYGGFYNSLITRLGVDSRNARSVSEAHELTIGHLEQLRQSVAGVNLDEEMVNLVQHQRAYEAAARIVDVIDEMLDTLINRMI